MAVVRKNLVLNFEAENETKLDITVLRPKAGLDGADVKEAMDTILASGALGAASPATKIVGAQYDIREIEEIVLN